MKNHMAESHVSLFGLKFWTFNLGDNQPTLEPVFGVEGRSTTILYSETLYIIYETKYFDMFPL